MAVDSGSPRRYAPRDDGANRPKTAHGRRRKRGPCCNPRHSLCGYPPHFCRRRFNLFNDLVCRLSPPRFSRLPRYDEARALSYCPAIFTRRLSACISEHRKELYLQPVRATRNCRSPVAVNATVPLRRSACSLNVASKGQDSISWSRFDRGCVETRRNFANDRWSAPVEADRVTVSN